MTDERRGRRDGRGRRYVASVTTRVLVLVLVPLLGLGAIAFGTLPYHGRAAGSAAAVHEAVGRVDRLVAVRAALFKERILAMSAAVVKEKGIIDLAAARAFTGFDIGERHAAYVGESNAAAAALGPDAGVLDGIDLAQIRRQADGTPPSQAAVVEAYLPVEQRIDAAKDGILTDAQRHLDTVGGGTVADGLGALRLQMDAMTQVNVSIEAFVALFLEEGDPSVHLLRLATSSDAVGRSVLQSGQGSHPIVNRAVEAFESSPSIIAYRANIDQLVRGDYPKGSQGPADWKRVADLSVAALDHNSLLFELIDATAAAVGDTAAGLQADAERALTWWSVTVYSLMVLTVVVSVALGRSINRPLRRLRDHAAALTAGDVDIDPLPVRGPKDVAVTARAFNDLVANLKLLDAKTRALAALDLDAEALATPLPGRLGEALQGSVAAVSGSITERDELRRHIVHQASHDELTGLLNRSAITDTLDRTLTRARRTGRGVAVLLVDIDGFKRLNDAQSHTVGDRILFAVGDRLSRVADEGMVARVGADQFVVVVDDVTDPEPVAKFARAIGAFDGPLHVDGSKHALTVSVGVSFSWDVDDAGQMLARADLALTRAKSRGPGSVEIFDPALQEQLTAQASIEDALSGALAGDDELFLQYQPVVDLASGAMTSVEALVRWNRPDLGIQPPDSFIPVAERSNLIVDLDRWVMARAARQAETWRAHGLGDIDIAVNISGRHLTSERLFDHVRSLLHTTPTEPRRLTLEITETALVDDLVVAASQLEAIRSLGVKIAIDDFGTGYTSIAHLRRLPVDIIKIDRSFVAKLGNAKERALLRMITDLGHELGNTITAEGVETPEQYEALQQIGCDRAQGFLMSRPLLPTDLELWVGRRAVTR